MRHTCPTLAVAVDSFFSLATRWVGSSLAENALVAAARHYVRAETKSPITVMTGPHVSECLIACN